MDAGRDAAAADGGRLAPNLEAVHLIEAAAERPLELADHSASVDEEHLDRGGHQLAAEERHILRKQGEPRPAIQLRRVVDRLDDGSYLAKFGDGKQTLTVRAIEYTLPGSTTIYRPLTSLLDPVMTPAHELVALYAERWEIEVCDGELEVVLWALRALRSPEPRRREVAGRVELDVVAHFLGSDGALELTVPAGAVTAGDVQAAGGAPRQVRLERVRAART